MFIPFLLQEETKEHLFKDFIKKYLNVGTKQFLKNVKHDRHDEKRKKKETRGAKVTIKQAYEDKSRGKSFTHQKLQVFLTKYGENALCENYTRAELTILCAAYGSECKTRMKKDEVGGKLALKINRMQCIPNPYLLLDNRYT